MTVYFAIGSAADERISRMAQAMINSSSVIPASEKDGLRWTLLRLRPRYEVLGSIVRTIRLLLDLQRRLSRYQRYQLLLRIFRIHLHDRQVRRALRQPLDDDADQRPASAHSWCVGLARRGNYRLSFFLKDLLDDSDFLSSA